ncbi:MAG: glycoside hydrolase family 88 protein [Pseudomonadales bacterium]
MIKSRLTLLVGALVLAGCSSDKAPTIAAVEPTAAEPQLQTTSNVTAPDTAFCSVALDAAAVQLDGFRKAYPDPTQIARSYEKNAARLVSDSDWTSGFVAGSFWYMYEHTQDPSWLATAEQWTVGLEQQKNNTGTHDIGFMMFPSYGNGLRLTGNASYEPILIQSADSLMTRYNATVGATRSWDHGPWAFPVIIDNMMNLELLYFASDSTGDQKYANAANSHSLTTLKNHFRADHSSYHVIDYDPATGAVTHKQTHQGIADDSAWARGQAWGLYGYTMAYRFSEDAQFLQQAQNIADFYLSHPNLPEDMVPYFDFDAPGNPEIVNSRDSSAASVTASALLELAAYAPEPQATRYHEAALAMLRSLASPAYSATNGENGHFLLMHATGRWQADDEVDAAINYADYYYLEALQRCASLNDK